MDDVWTERATALASLVDRAEQEHCYDLVPQLRWEAMLAYAYVSNAALRERDRPRFVTVHPDLSDAEALDYLVSRATVPSAYLRSRVQDFLWEHGGPTRRRHAVDAGASYLEVAGLEAADATNENTRWLGVGDALVRAAELAKAANQKPTIRAIADSAFALLQRLEREGNKRNVLDIGLALAELADVLTDDEAEQANHVLVITAAAYLRERDYNLSRAAMDVRRRFAVARKQPDDVLRSIDIEIAQSCMAEGEQREREGSALIASIAFNQAVALFERIGSEKQLTDAARAALRRTREAGVAEMKPISSGPIKLTPEHQAQMERVIEAVSAAQAPDCFRLFALHPNLLVTRDQAQQMRQMLRETAPLTQVLPRVILRRGAQALAPTDPVQAERLALFQTGVQLLRVQDGLYLNPILRRVIEREELGPAAVMLHLVGSGHIPLEAQPVVEAGIRRLWERDWISALHILIPQLEEVLRSLARRTGRDTMRTHQNLPGVTIEVPLGYVLDELAEVITDDGVIFMLELVLDLYGLNLRNLFCHGLADIGDCDIDNTARVLQLFLIVAGLHAER